MKSKKQILLSGIAPSGHLTIGNYVGAIRNWLKMQEQYDCIFTLVDMHAITVRQDPESLRSRCRSFIAQFIACGLDPEKCTIFVQSHVSAHAELAWVLGCLTYTGELNRMTQFKDKAKNHPSNINAGLYTYPVLMASDILLYQTEVVPIGQDQKQHLELTRDIAVRFNSLYGNTFKMPSPCIPEVGARIMSLLEPSRKMDKSDTNSDNYIALLDEPDVILGKIKRAVTDSGTEIKAEKAKSGISNLLAIHSSLSGISLKELEEKYRGKNYSTFKGELAELIVEKLGPLREKYKKIMDTQDYISRILSKGAESAALRANETLRAVYEKIGFIGR